MSTDSKNRLQAYRETLPVLIMLNDSFQKSEKLSGDYFSKLYKIAKMLEPSYSATEEKKRWEAIVGSPPYEWESKYESSTYEVDAKAKKYISVLLTYIKSWTFAKID